MSGHGVPSNYLGATRLGPDANACLSMARAKWHTLSSTQQAALLEAGPKRGGYMIGVRSVSTSKALFEQGLTARVHKWAPLTGFGIMVREAGIYTRDNPEPVPCPNIARACKLGAAWADGAPPHPELLRWVHVFMMELWDGQPVGSLLTTGMELARRVGVQLGILDKVSPVGMHGVLPLCELAGWPKSDGTPRT